MRKHAKFSAIAIVLACFVASTAIAGAATNPASWAIQASPNLGSGVNQLHDVSCPSARFCMAVGQITPDAGYQNMGMRWNGTTWRPATPPSRANAESSLSHVACTSSTFCLAVGSSQSLGNADLRALVERWDGRRWSVLANPAGVQNSVVIAVACPSPTSCVLLGTTWRHGTPIPLFETWDGTTLTAVPAPALRGAAVDVSCPTPTQCVAVGVLGPNGYDGTLVEAYDGSNWSVVDAPNPSTISRLDAVSCAGATSCVAIGQYYDWDANQWLELTEAWDGETWTQRPSPGAIYTVGDIACTAPTNCVAVGRYTPSGTKFTANRAWRWNGTAWTPYDPPNAGHFSNSLTAVSCPSAATCRAVGTWTHDHIQQTLVLA